MSITTEVQCKFSLYPTIPLPGLFSTLVIFLGYSRTVHCSHWGPCKQRNMQSPSSPGWQGSGRGTLLLVLHNGSTCKCMRPVLEPQRQERNLAAPRFCELRMRALSPMESAMLSHQGACYASLFIKPCSLKQLFGQAFGLTPGKKNYPWRRTNSLVCEQIKVSTLKRFCV